MTCNRAFYKNKKIKIIFTYEPALVEKVKKLIGRKYVSNHGQRFWTAPLCTQNIEILQDIKDIHISDKLLSWYARKTAPNKIHTPRLPEHLESVLYPFQKEGIGFLLSRKGKALIGDEMGLGKTVQSLGFLETSNKHLPALIIVPASIKYKWESEVEKWCRTVDFMHICSGKTPQQMPNNISNTVVIINYEILQYWIKALAAIPFRTVIMDECHYIKNSKARRTKYSKCLAKKAKNIIGLSGTPIINKPVEMFNMIQLIDPTLFPSYWDYTQKYCDAKYNGFTIDVTGASNTDELHSKLSSTIMLRRLKKDVLKELPPKIRSVVPIDLSNKSEYHKAEINLLRDSDTNILARIEKLKQLCIKGKMKECITWIKDFLQDKEKLVVFATHTNTISELKAAFPKISVTIDGSTKNKHKVAQQFQSNKDIKLLLGNIKAAGVGLDLYAADTTCFVELGWTVGEHDQAEDRVHRIGQQSQSVAAYYLIANNTIENDIVDLLDKKREVLSEVLDGRKVDEISMLKELLKKRLNETHQ